MGAGKTTLSILIFIFTLLSRHAALQLCERVKQVRRVLCFSPPWPPSASANKTFLDLYNCSVCTQPHPTIAKYLTTSSLAYFPTSASDGLHVWHFLGPLGVRLSYLPNGIMAGD